MATIRAGRIPPLRVQSGSTVLPKAGRYCMLIGRKVPLSSTSSER
jgi:hypothetical protein